MENFKHVIKSGKYKDKQLCDIASESDIIEFLTDYIKQLSELHEIKEVNSFIKTLVFNKKMEELDEIIFSSYDSKMKSKGKDAFYETYLNYLSFRHAGCSISQIKDDRDFETLDKIINTLLEIK